jgi:predicted NBD/HSP70 family sugar kinase
MIHAKLLWIFGFVDSADTASMILKDQKILVVGGPDRPAVLITALRTLVTPTIEGPSVA